MSNHPNRRTITLDESEYRVNGSAVECFRAIDTGVDWDYSRSLAENLEKTERWAWCPTKYVVGALAVLVSSRDVSPNALRAGTDRSEYRLSFDLDGVPGNSNPKIKSTTGWRGTTNDISVTAHGVVKIVKIERTRRGIAVRVNF